MRHRRPRPSAGAFKTWIVAFATVLALTAVCLDQMDLNGDRKLCLASFILVELGLLELSAILLRRFLRRYTQAEGMLRDSEEFARSIVDAMPMHIAILDGDGKLLKTNRAWREFGSAGGADNDRVEEGSNYLAVCDELGGVRRDPRGSLLAAGIREVAAGKREEFQLEYPIRIGDRIRWFVGRVTRFPGVRSFRLVLAHDDISRRKSAEEEVNKAREDAELANAAKSAFLANTSHEIRTPMNAILGYAEMLLNSDQSDAERRSCVRTIRRNGEHLLAIINDILDLSKIEAEKLKVEKIACDVPQLLADVIAIVRPWADRKGLKFDAEFDQTLPQRIQSDPLRVRQVLLNLLSNAIKFTEAGRVTLAVHREISYFAHSLRFTVTDTGIGLTPQQAARLFEPFTQADVSTTRKFGGTGLGLTVSRRLARLLGGDIECSSEDGRGSVFTFRVDGGPRADVPLIENLTPDQLPSGAEDDPSDARDIQIRGRILLAEDGEDNRELVASHLHRAGAQVVIAGNGRLAVEAARTQTFDLVLMDMQMPELDGYEATRALRKAGLNIPIIALTANAMSEDRIKCLEAGCTEYLSKPISRLQLLTALQRFLPESDGPVRAEESEAIQSTIKEQSPLHGLLEKFVSRLPDRVSALQSLLQERNLDNLRQAVHQLKGAASGYGFPAVTEIAGRAEKKIRDGDALEAIRAEVDSLVALVRSIDGYDRARETAAPAVGVSAA